MPFLRFYATLSPSEGISIPPNPLERLAKEVKRRTKVVEVFCDEGAVGNLLYLVLSQLDEAWGTRMLRGFAEIQIGNYHVALTH
jgi:transposase-like protein